MKNEKKQKEKEKKISYKNIVVRHFCTKTFTLTVGQPHYA